jgi:hypothetical protein
VFSVFGYKEYQFDLEKILKKRNEILNNLQKIDSFINNLTESDYLKEDLELYQNLKELLSQIPSDSRLPVADVSLWAQTYLSVSLYKARLA